MDIKPKLENIDLGEVLGLGAALGAAKTLGPGPAFKPYAALPPSWSLQDLEKFLPAPTRAKGLVKAGDAASFIRYVNKHKDAAGAASRALATTTAGETGSAPVATDGDDMQTVILVDVIASKFLAVFDHHASNAPGWQEHKVSYDCPLSPQWKLWNAASGKDHAKDQEEFAFFIEQNMLDVLEPNGATMLQIVTTLKASKSVQFDSGIRLSDGQTQLKYHEQITTTAGGNNAGGNVGELQIPEKIALAIPVYVGQAPYRVDAFLRYRLNRGSILFWYDLITPERILEDALGKVRAEIEKGTSIEAYSVTGF